MIVAYSNPGYMGLSPKIDPNFMERAKETAKKIFEAKMTMPIPSQMNLPHMPPMMIPDTMYIPPFVPTKKEQSQNIIPIVLIAGAGIAGIMIFKKMKKGKKVK